MQSETRHKYIYDTTDNTATATLVLFLPLTIISINVDVKYGKSQGVESVA